MAICDSCGQSKSADKLWQWGTSLLCSRCFQAVRSKGTANKRPDATQLAVQQLETVRNIRTMLKGISHVCSNILLVHADDKFLVSWKEEIEQIHSKMREILADYEA